MNSCACASRAARSTSSSVASGAPKAMFSRTVAEKRNGSCATTPIVAAQRGQRHVAHVGAVDRDAARRRRRRSAGRARRASSCPSRCGRSARRSGPARARGRRRCEHGPRRRRSRSRRARSGRGPSPGGSGARVRARRATSSGSSITSKIRSPDAVARCAWPIHMPSMRSGMTSISDEQVEGEEVAELRARRRRPSARRRAGRAACASSGRNESSGT